MENNEQVILTRDCEAILIPYGDKVTLRKGDEGTITQDLGGSYTLLIRGSLLRIDGKDADAIGKELAPAARAMLVTLSGFPHPATQQGMDGLFSCQ